MCFLIYLLFLLSWYYEPKWKKSFISLCVILSQFILLGSTALQDWLVTHWSLVTSKQLLNCPQFLTKLEWAPNPDFQITDLKFLSRCRAGYRRVMPVSYAVTHRNQMTTKLDRYISHPKKNSGLGLKSVISRLQIHRLIEVKSVNGFKKHELEWRRWN